MHLIKECPSCKKKLRFPIDKGTIRVVCKCGYEFIADPDDPCLFQEGVFDIGKTLKKKKNGINSVIDIIEYCNIQTIKKGIVSFVLDKKYHIQNFKILPAREQIKLIFSLILLVLIIVFIIVLVLFFRNSLMDHGNVI